MRRSRHVCLSSICEWGPGPFPQNEAQPPRLLILNLDGGQVLILNQNEAQPPRLLILNLNGGQVLILNQNEAQPPRLLILNL